MKLETAADHSAETSPPSKILMSPEDRRKYIGASECAGVLALSRYASPLQIWSVKTG